MLKTKVDRLLITVALVLIVASVGSYGASFVLHVVVLGGMEDTVKIYDWPILLFRILANGSFGIFVLWTFIVVLANVVMALPLFVVLRIVYRWIAAAD